MGSFIKKVFIFVIAIAFLATGGFFLWASTLSIPSLTSLDKRKVVESTKIYDRTGEVLLYDLHSDIHRTIVSSEKISKNIKNAAVAIEDEEFYEHLGVSPTDIIRAIIVDITSLEFKQGGSTITQQVIKNALLSQEKKVSRKLKEWILAVKLDNVMKKEDILTLYLNESPYGGNIYGVEEASQRFFGKSASEVTLAEATYLASLPKAPTYYSPYGNNREALEKRKNKTLKKMLELGFIEKDEYKSAKEEEVNFIPYGDQDIKAPHFVIFIREYLEQKYGEDVIRKGGFKVTTTLDFELQKEIQKIIKKRATKNEKKFNAENAGAVVIDPKTGQILSMVGSRDYFDEDIQGNFNITLAHRQPGSAFKPFVYATAIKEGYTPKTVVFDLKTQFSTACKPDYLKSKNDCYAPVNYDETFRGPVTLREALAQSINVPSVKTLYLTGIDDALKTANAMGIKNLRNAGHYGLNLVLGGGEVTLLDLTSAYGVFANNGIKNNHTGILEIKNKDGEIIEQQKKNPTRVLSSKTAAAINDILSDNKARTPAFGANSPLHFSENDVAVKTGTTDDYRDAWTVGYSPNISVGVWAGNNDNTPMKKKVAGYIVAPIWRKVIKTAMEKMPKKKRDSFEEFEYNYNKDTKPILRGIWKGGESYYIDKASGKLATKYTPESMKEEKIVKNFHSILYWVKKNNPTGEYPQNHQNDLQFNHWEYSIDKWKEKNNIKENTKKPEEKDDIHKPENNPTIHIKKPIDNKTFELDEKIKISIKVDSEFPLNEVEFYIDNRLLGTDKQKPFSFSFLPNIIGLSSGNYDLRVKVSDKYLNKKNSKTEIEIK